MKLSRVLIVLVAFCSIAFAGNAQKTVSGLVVDSVSLTNLVGVHVLVKGTQRATTTNYNGIFSILAYPKDTLVFTFLGYLNVVLPADFGEDVMFVRMHDTSIMLNEVVVRDYSYLDKKYVYSPTLSTIKPLQAAGINFGYFSKGQKERRKLVEVIKEYDKAKTYIAVVTDPSIREEIIEKYSITEAKYYELLAIFNQKNAEIMHSSNADYIIFALHEYFAQALDEK